jgi:hypothetical protein
MNKAVYTQVIPAIIFVVAFAVLFPYFMRKADREQPWTLFGGWQFRLGLVLYCVIQLAVYGYSSRVETLIMPGLVVLAILATIWFTTRRTR